MIRDIAIAQAIKEIAGNIEGNLVLVALGRLPGGVLSDTAKDRISKLGAFAAETLAVQMTESQLNALGEVIGRIIAQGKRPVDHIGLLRQVKDLDSVRAAKYQKAYDMMLAAGESPGKAAVRLEKYKKQLLNERKRTIARTEANRAVSLAQEAMAVDRGAKYKVWITLGDDRVSDACQANESQGAIDIDDTFVGGVLHPPQHPNCRCTLTYVTSDAVKDLQNEAATERALQTESAKS